MGEGVVCLQAVVVFGDGGGGGALFVHKRLFFYKFFFLGGGLFVCGCLFFVCVLEGVGGCLSTVFLFLL